MAEVITPFQGDKEDKCPKSFLRAFFWQMADKSDETRKAQFAYYLQPYSVANDWFANLLDEEKKSWASIEAAFGKRWPKKKLVKKMEEEYEDKILNRKLKEEDLGKKEKVPGMDMYTHVAWADKMATSVRGAGLEMSHSHIRQVRKELPNILKEKIETGHASWNTFLQAVREVDIEYIKDAMDRKKKEQAALNQRFQMIESVSRSPTAPIRQQLSAVAISRQPAPVAATANNNINPFINPGGGQGNLRFVPAPATPQYNRPSQPNTNLRPPPTAEQKAELRALINSMPHHPDTQAGRQAHQA